MGAPPAEAESNPGNAALNVPGIAVETAVVAAVLTFNPGNAAWKDPGIAVDVASVVPVAAPEPAAPAVAPGPK
jgi:hypothetical protein